MKKELIIISDLWGKRKSDWWIHYQQILSADYDIKYYDSCALGGVDISQYEEGNIHEQFVDFGIQNAVDSLLRLEKNPKLYIGCSVGGVIAWKAGLLGLPIEKLLTISATRLSMETEKPGCPIQMYFGELDEYQPDSNWFNAIGAARQIILNGTHDSYKEKACITQIFKELKEKQWIDLK